MAEPIEMPLGLWTLVSPRKHVLCRVHTLAQSGEYYEAMRPSCQITLTTCYKYTALIANNGENWWSNFVLFQAVCCLEREV